MTYNMGSLKNFEETFTKELGKEFKYHAESCDNVCKLTQDEIKNYGDSNSKLIDFEVFRGGDNYFAESDFDYLEHRNFGLDKIYYKATRDLFYEHADAEYVYIGVIINDLKYIFKKDNKDAALCYVQDTLVNYGTIEYIPNYPFKMIEKLSIKLDTFFLGGCFNIEKPATITEKFTREDILKRNMSYIDIERNFTIVFLQYLINNRFYFARNKKAFHEAYVKYVINRDVYHINPKSSFYVLYVTFGNALIIFNRRYGYIPKLNLKDPQIPPIFDSVFTEDVAARKYF